MKYKFAWIIAFIGIMMSINVMAYQSCTPSAPAQNYKFSKIVDTPFDAIIDNATSGGNCYKDGGTKGDFCIRHGIIVNGCYGPAVSFDTYYYQQVNLSNVANIIARVWYSGLPTTDCYLLRTISQTDTNNPSLSYNGVHTFGNATAQYSLGGWSITGTTPYSHVKYVYIEPAGYAQPAGYDFYWTQYARAETSTLLQGVSGGNPAYTASAIAENDFYSVPKKTNLAINTTCLQNSLITSPNVVLNISASTGNISVPWPGTGNYPIQMPSGNFTIDWYVIDDSQDNASSNNGSYTSASYPSNYSMSFNNGYGVAGCSGLIDGTQYECTYGSCFVHLSCQIPGSSLTLGSWNAFLIVNDGFDAIRGSGFAVFRTFNITGPKTINLTLIGPANQTAYATGSFINFNYSSISQTNSSALNTLIAGGNTLFSGIEANGAHNHSYQFNNSGTYSWNVQGSDENGMVVSQTRIFTIQNASFPTISSYNVNNPNVPNNVMCNATIIAGTYAVQNATCYFSPQGMLITMSNVGGNLWYNYALTSAAWASFQNWTIKTCDTQGNCVNVTGNNYINHDPLFDSQYGPNGTINYSPSAAYAFNVTFSEDINMSSAQFMFGASAYSATRIGTTNSFQISLGSQNVGTYNWRFNGTDIGGLINVTSLQTLTINKAVPTMNHIMGPSFTVASGTTVTGICQVINTAGGNIFYNKCGLSASATIATPNQLGVGPIIPAIGSYTCNCTSEGTANWNRTENLQTLTVSGVSLPVITNKNPVNATFIDENTNVYFNATITPASYPVSSARIILWANGLSHTGVELNASMTNVAGNDWQYNGTISPTWTNLAGFEIRATDSNGNSASNETVIFVNHAPLYSALNVFPVSGGPLNASMTYKFNSTWMDDWDTYPAAANITMDGVVKAATSLGSGKFNYSFLGLGSGTHNYTWTSVDSRGLVKTTAMQFYDVNIQRPILQIFINPSVSVIYGTTTNASCIVDQAVSINLYRDGVGVSNPDVQTLAPGTYTYLCNSTPNVNFTSAYTTDVLIVNSPSAQTQTQFCDGQLSETYTYQNGGENFTMCVKVPCGSNITGASIDLTGQGLYKWTQYFSNVFVRNDTISGCTIIGTTYQNLTCQNSTIINAAMYNARVYNSTINNTIANYIFNISNVVINNSYVMNGKLIWGNIGFNENVQVQFDN